MMERMRQGRKPGHLNVRICFEPHNKNQMKLIRFIKKVVNVQELTTLMWSTIATCIVALIFWGIGWVAHYFGMQPFFGMQPLNREYEDFPAIGCGSSIFMVCLIVLLLISVVYWSINKFKWLYAQWRDA